MHTLVIKMHFSSSSQLLWVKIPTLHSIQFLELKTIKKQFLGASKASVSRLLLLYKIMMLLDYCAANKSILWKYIYEDRKNIIKYLWEKFFKMYIYWMQYCSIFFSKEIEILTNIKLNICENIHQNCNNYYWVVKLWIIISLYAFWISGIKVTWTTF